MPRERKSKADKTGLTVSIVFHVVIGLIVFFWAAKTGKFDPLLKAFDVAIAPKKTEEKPKPKEEPKPEEVKTDAPKNQLAPPPEQANTAPPPPSGPPAEATVAPAAAVEADFAFDDGAKPTTTIEGTPITYYKSQIEYAIKSNWDRPTAADDDRFLAEVQVQIDKKGKILGHTWKKGSGNPEWDNSVKKAIANTRAINRPPPPGFPETFAVQFDVVNVSEPLVQ